MEKGPCGSFGRNGDHDQLNSALTGNAFGADHQLRHVGSPGIGDETGVRYSGVLKFSGAGIGFGREGPLKAQWLRR